jgi:hypothetical protein
MELASTSSIFRLAQGRKIGEGAFVSQRTGEYRLQLMVPKWSIILCTTRVKVSPDKL